MFGLVFVRLSKLLTSCSAWPTSNLEKILNWIILHTLPTRGIGQAALNILGSCLDLPILTLARFHFLQFVSRLHLLPIGYDVLGFQAQDNGEHPPQLHGDPLDD